MTCREAIQEAFQNANGILSSQDVISRIYAKYPTEPWQRNTISATLIGLSVNHSSSHHYPTDRKHAFLFSLGNGRYRLWNQESDGDWKVTPTGVQLVDEGGDAIVAEESADEEISAVGMSLSLERDLEANIIGHLDSLEPGLKLYSQQGVRGQQLDTGIVGRLDLLAQDSQGRFVVVELKVGKADDKVCGQVLRYMGWVKRNVAGGREVRGIIVANEFTERLRFAAEATSNVDLKKYQIHFTFHAG